MSHGDRTADASRIARYRARAEELRAIAAQMKDPQSKSMLLITVADYERMADALERAAQGHDDEKSRYGE